MNQTPPAEPGGGSIEELVQQELQLPEPPQAGDGRMLDHPPHDLFGLALSGGGIRSATFNLGLLQGLHELKLLRSFDYLSTVSGGGYIGSFWTRWRQAEVEAAAAAEAAASGGADAHEGAGGPRDRRFPDRLNDPLAPEPGEVRHLREFSNFLAPRLGIFSFDTGRIVVALISSIVPSLLATLAFLLLLMLAWAALAWALLGAAVAAPAGPRLSGASWVTMLAITVLTLAAFELAWRRRGELGQPRHYLLGVAVGLVVVLAAWLLLGSGAVGAFHAGGPLPAGRPPGEPLSWWLPLFAPCLAWAAAAAVLIATRWLGSPWVTDIHRRGMRTALDRVQSRMYFLVAAWAALALLWAAGAETQAWIAAAQRTAGLEPAGRAGALAGLVAVLTALFAKVQQLFSREPNRPAGSSVLRRLRPYLPQLLAYAAVALMVVGVVAAIVAAGAAADGVLPAVAGLAVAATLLTLFFFNPNEMGLHSFYRSRIVRAYLGASNAARRRTTEEHEADDVRLDAIDAASDPPFHLICCAVNDTNPVDPLENLHRGAVSGALSRLGWSVGRDWARWKEQDAFVPTLGAAVTASGAAFNPLMGAKSVEFGPAVTFLMAAFNLRLGMWLPHPGRVREATRGGGRRWHDRKPIGFPFYKELLGLASAGASHVHLSDGGHFENMAVYELIRRHCRVIVASDCGQDPDVVFDDLGNLVRRVREDFGVDLKIDLEPLKPGADGLARQPMVAGDIFYPDGDTGVLLLFKPTLIGAEPPDIAQYKSRNAHFPHETTGDQFYDAAQWEAYRRLGEFAARSAFRTVSLGIELEPSALAVAAAAHPVAVAADERGAYGELFAQARREWLPRPAGYDERISRVADRIAELDTLLRQPECEPVLREVYKEIDELDRQAASRVEVYGIAREPASGGAPASFRLGEPGPADAEPGSANLALTLYLIRRALLLLEEVYQREDLERNGSHPLYLGVTNYFARWAFAPAFRMWWPLLKTMYTQPFTRWVERQFSLGAVRTGLAPEARLVASVEQGGTGFAMMCWQQTGRQWPPAGHTDPDLISFFLQMRYGADRPYTVQAAQVVGRRVPATPGTALIWRSADFFVPPGLWGVGIGSDFLRRLGRGAVDGVTAGLLAVSVEAEKARGTAARRELANEMQLYRSTGFTEVEAVADSLTYAGITVGLPADVAGADTKLIRHWMVRAVSAEPARAAAADAARGARA